MSLPATNFSSQKKHYIPYLAKTIMQSIPKPILISKHIVSEEMYWRNYYELSNPVYEWNNGYLEERPVSDHATFLIYHWFVHVLSMFLYTRPIATFSGLEMGFRLNNQTVRKPNFGVVLNDNPVPLLENDRSYHGIFDLCVEALSDSDKQQKERDTLTKKAEYANTGVKEYFILHHSEDQAFYRLNAQGLYVPIVQHEKDIICSEVLPGFQFRISDLLARPSPEAMLEDLIYQGFLFPAWQLDKKRAQTEAAMRVEAEQLAKMDAAIAQNEIARLKALLGL